MFEQIREFSFDRHDFPTLVRNLSTILRWLTLNVDRRHNKRIPIIYYLLMLVSLFCYIYAYQVSAYWFIFFRDAEDEKLEKMITFSQCVCTMVGATKFLNMYLKKDELMGIIDAYLVCDSRVDPHSRLSKNINTTLRVVKKRAVILWLAFMGNIFYYILIRPIVITDRESMKDYIQIWGLEPMLETPNYELTVSIIGGVIPFVVAGPLHIIIFLIVVVGYSEAQMTALSKELLSLWDDTETDYHEQTSEIEHPNTSSTHEELLKRRLEEILKSHAMNIQLILQVESVFRNGIAFQLMILSIGIVACLLAGLENTYTSLPLYLVLVGADCYTSQNLMDASKAFEDAVYECQWEKFDKNNRKLVLIMLQNAQKTLTLSAGGVSRLDYESFMFIIKYIYQVYAGFQSK